jgi:hypothetical protein
MRWDHDGRQRHSGEHTRHGHVRDWITSGDTDKEVAGHLPEHDRDDNAERHAGSYGGDALAQHKAEDGAAWRS